MPYLSIVIPIYRVEAYLDRCVKSVLAQNVQNMEIVLVDDGSPDGCPAICDRFAKQDSRIKVIHKQNGGLSSARNVGINVATGEYIMFLDSDDAWAEGKLKEVLTDLDKQQVDMLTFFAWDITKDGKMYVRSSGDEFDGNYCILQKDEYYRRLIESGNLLEAAYTKVFRTSFLRENGLLFQKGLIGEDTEWMFRVLRVVRYVAVSKVPLYVFSFGRTGSITNTRSEKSLFDILRIISQSLAYYNANPSSDTKPYELAHCGYLFSIALGMYGNWPFKEAKKFAKEIKKYAYLLAQGNVCRKVKLVCVCRRLLGIRITGMVLNWYITMNRTKFWSRQRVNE